MNEESMYEELEKFNLISLNPTLSSVFVFLLFFLLFLTGKKSKKMNEPPFRKKWSKSRMSSYFTIIIDIVITIRRQLNHAWFTFVLSGWSCKICNKNSKTHKKIGSGCCETCWSIFFTVQLFWVHIVHISFKAGIRRVWKPPFSVFEV